MKVALITGASSGIGAAAAIEFADAGWSVMAAGRDAGRLEEVAGASDNIATWEGDLDSSVACDELVADTIDEFGRIDCLVNCAGILTRGSAADTDDEDWRDTMHINLDVPFYLSRAALPFLLEATGSIVNIASDWGLQAGTDHVAYCVSKGGLVMLTRAMAKDHARAGLRVNAVCPGDVDTPMLAAEAEMADEDLDEFVAEAAEDSPNGRIAEPGEIASLVLYLASDAARHITGTTVAIDGGATA
jgi:NAD(P)-dependent dehydrogenase (short-subunit alcohol dehydrogenase family)